MCDIHQGHSLCMSEYAPLIQTILWVVLIVWLIFRYDKQIISFLKAIQDRIDKGSPLKIGSLLDIGQGIEAQDTQEMKKRFDDEIKVPQATTAQGQAAQSSENLNQSIKLRKNYLLAEDLIMRELQSEFGAVINRSVRLGGVELDGIFAHQGNGYGVEVKFIHSQVVTEGIISSLNRIESGLRRFGWKKFTIILALVHENENNINSSFIEKIQARASDMSAIIMIRVYTLRALEEKYGISSS
jgi:hypothetical protein